MDLFTCNACLSMLYADTIPDACPHCKVSSVILQPAAGKKVLLPAMRPATVAEQSVYQEISQGSFPALSISERIACLSEYPMTDHEYHTALMLIFYSKDTPEILTTYRLEDLLLPRNSFSAQKTAIAAASGRYDDVVKRFTQKIAAERKNAGTTDITKVAQQFGTDSAAGILTLFHREDSKKPNLNTIRNVDIDTVAKEPGNGYMRFLIDWYNSVSGTPR